MKRALLLLFLSVLWAQFGKNKVQHKDYEWFYIQTKHYDVYFNEEGRKAAEFAAAAAEDALERISNDLNYQIGNRIIFIVYNSHNDFQETNTSDSYISQGIGGFTEPFKNRVVLPFEGDYEKFRHVIHHEMVHAVMQDLLYGGKIQNVISKGITLNLPLWVHEGMAEFLSSGWETNSDQFISDAIINEYLPDINRLGGYFAYRGGQSLYKFIAEKYGRQKVGEILMLAKDLNSIEDGIKKAIGLTIEELNEKWKKDLKRQYWPAIEYRVDPDEFAKRLTNNKKTGGFYNSSPALSPQGDKLAFISDRDIFFDIYLLDVIEGEVIKKLAESGRTNDFEELNVLTPALTWAPDNKRIALSVKSDGFDVIQVIDTETEDYYQLPLELDGIGSISWSPDGKYIAIVGHNTFQADIYIYNINTEEVVNLTNDIFTDDSPAWSPDSKTIYFASDRKEIINPGQLNDDFFMFNHDFHQQDIYRINLDSKKIDRITDWEHSTETSPVVSPDNKYLLFTSDYNGISNIYRKSIEDTPLENKSEALTNSLNGINQLSISNDGKKLSFSSLYNSGYNIFTLNNPFTKKALDSFPAPTKYIESVLSPKDENEEQIAEQKNDKKTSKNDYSSFIFSTKKLNEVKEPDSTLVATTESSDTNKTSEEPVIFTGTLVKESSTSDTTSSKQYENYVFGMNYNPTKEDDNPEIKFEEKLDDDGNYLVHKYKVKFTPDIIYANAGYSTFYGLLGTTVLSFSDVLGNHRLIGVTSMQIDLKNSDYGLSYYYLKDRTNYGVQLFHTARFLYISNSGFSRLHRFRNYGAVLTASHPLSTFDRIEGGLSLLNVSSENLDDFSVPTEKITYVLPSASYVHDNSFWGYYSPIEGSRYKITAFGNPGITNHEQSFYSVVWDFRKYYRFWYDNSLAIRFSGGFSGGANPQRFMLGGISNWINRRFHTGDIPLDSASDFAFLTPAYPMRGFDYAQQMGTKYSLLNIELRMPFIRYLLTGPIPLLFQNILSNVFLDVGTAWDDNQKLQLFHTNEFGQTETKDLLIGMGTGLRTYLLFFLARLDVAWSYNGHSFSKPQYYFSIGTDF